MSNNHVQLGRLKVSTLFGHHSMALNYHVASLSLDFSKRKSISIHGHPQINSDIIINCNKHFIDLSCL